METPRNGLVAMIRRHADRLGRRQGRGTWTLAAAAVAACAAPVLPPAPPAATVPPVIVVPGLQASRLVSAKTGEAVWEASLPLVLTGAGFEELALPIGSLPPDQARDDLVPQGVIRDAFLEDFYGDLIDGLERRGGRSCVSPREIDARTNCVILAWDWRRDMVEAAGRLDMTIERLREARGDPDEQVDVIAHSAGGLVTRYFLRYGAEDVLDEASPPEPTLVGAEKVRRALLIAPPNFGSIFGLQRVMRGHEIGLVKAAPELTATMPSVYQLLPHPDRRWMIDLKGDPLAIDLYDIDTWRFFRESIFRDDARERLARAFDDREAFETYYAQLVRFFERGLRRGERFQRALSIPVEEMGTRVALLGASCRETPAVCLLGYEDGRPVIRLHPDEIDHPVPGVDYRRLMLAPGDGRVTLSSLAGRRGLAFSGRGRPTSPSGEPTLVCGEHDTLPSEPEIIDEILRRLKAPDENEEAGASGGTRSSPEA